MRIFLALILITTFVFSHKANLKPSEEVANFLTKHQLEIVDFHYIQKVFLDNNATFVDTRNPMKFYTKTIPNAISVYDKNFMKNMEQFKKIGNSQEFIIFSNDKNCLKSSKVALSLKQDDYKNIKIYVNGMSEWERNYYSEVDAPFINTIIRENLPYQFLDLRNKKDFSYSHAENSINIRKFQDLKHKIAINKNIIIVLFSYKNDKTINKYAQTLVSKGYKNVNIYQKGYEEFKKITELNISTNTFKPFYGPIKKGKNKGSVDAIWFQNNLDKILRVATLVDVRGRSERTRGFIKGSKQVDLNSNSLNSFVSKLPKNRYLIFYCAAGYRAHEAYEMIDKNSSLSKRVFYLDAIVNCKKLKCKITPNMPTNPQNW